MKWKLNLKTNKVRKWGKFRDFSDSPLVKTFFFNAAGSGSIPGQGASNIPQASQPSNQNIKQKQDSNKFNKDFKMVHIQKNKIKSLGFPWWLSGKEFTCQSKRWVQSLIRKDATCHRAAELICLNYWSPCARQPVLPHNERSLQWEAWTSQWEKEPLLTATREGPSISEDPAQPKTYIKLYFFILKNKQNWANPFHSSTQGV